MKNITLIARVLISALFLLSAVAKLYPTPLYGITKVFEEGQLIPMGFSSDFAPFLSRLIIGFEFFIAKSCNARFLADAQMTCLCVLEILKFLGVINSKPCLDANFSANLISFFER